MNELFARAAGVFVAPAAPIPSRPLEAVPREPAARALGAFPPAQRALVLGPTGSALAVAAALAGELRVAARSATALLCAVVPADQPTPDPVDLELKGALATGPARRLATRLEGRGLEAVPRGRLAWLPLAGAVAPSFTAARRALAAVTEPAVLAVCGPRPAEVAELLADQDLVVLVAPTGASEDVLALARSELERSTEAPVIVARPSSRAAQTLALGGWGRLRGVEPELRGVVREPA